jgi:steroid delta-isomerase-like uncharacterized protein
MTTPDTQRQAGRAEVDGVDLVRQWAAAWSAHDVRQVVSLFTDDAIYEDVTLSVVNHGTDEITAFGHLFMTVAPDFHVELSSTVSSGDEVAAEWTMSGTHRGDLPAMPATGETFTIRGATAFQLTGDKFTRCSDYWDMATLMRQLGFLADPA